LSFLISLQRSKTYLNRGWPCLGWNPKLWTARAIGYRARHNIAPQDVSLAVVVQVLVPADAAGILFTANPLTGARSQMMINAAWGLGEAIVVYVLWTRRSRSRWMRA
jgi:hypothetical protein